MGVINHTAIIATTSNEKVFLEVVNWLQAYPKVKFATSLPSMNGYRSIVLFPDGSKEGWYESDYYDHIRDKFINKLDFYDYEDGSSPWDYVEIGFGEYGQKVLRGNNKNCFNDNEYAV